MLEITVQLLVVFEGHLAHAAQVIVNLTCLADLETDPLFLLLHLINLPLELDKNLVEIILHALLIAQFLLKH